VYRTIGASAHAVDDREEHDFYATDPYAAQLLLSVEKFDGPIWECAAGNGHLADVFREFGHKVYATDLVQREYPLDKQQDFLESWLEFESPSGDNHINVVTNPPYKYAKEFIEKALTFVAEGCKVAMFLKLTFCEGKGRKSLFQNLPCKTIYVSSSRIACGKNGDFSFVEDSGSAVCYAWFVWEKGFTGDTTIKWIN